VTPPRAIPILPKFDPDAIRQRLERHEFFWADLTLDVEASLDEIQSAFGLGPGAVAALKLFGRDGGDGGAPRRRVYVDAEHVVFPFWYVRRPQADVRERPEALEVHEVKVVLHGDYLLTVHETADDLTYLVGDGLPSGRSERYLVYVVLEAMTSTFFRALLILQDAMGEFQADVLASEGRAHRGDAELIRGVRLRLTELRRFAGPERVLFARASGEMEHVPGLEADHGRYFDRISQELDRIIDGIDAASGGLSSALQVQLNETTYRLTIVATIFLPLTFLTGFFGMNFGWMVDQVDSGAAFWLLGVGGCVAAVLLIVGFLVRQGAVSGPRAGAGR
jgi:magnesium transporter